MNQTEALWQLFQQLRRERLDSEPPWIGVILARSSEDLRPDDIDALLREYHYTAHEDHGWTVYVRGGPGEKRRLSMNLMDTWCARTTLNTVLEQLVAIEGELIS